VANFLFLFAPKSECNNISVTCPWSKISLGSHLSFLMSWDGFEFIDYAIQPSRLFSPNQVRQSRPLYIALGSALGYSVYYFSYPLHSFIEHHLPRTPTGQFSGEDNARSLQIALFLLGFILLNLVVLILSLALFERILLLLTGPWRHGSLLLNLLLFSLAANQLTKTFFWTAHTQLFSLLTPLLCIYVSIKLLRIPTGYIRLACIAMGAGLLLLLYGNFFLLLPVMVASLLAASAARSKKLVQVLVTLFFFLLPYLLWITTLHVIGLRYYSAEVSRYREFVWMLDAMQISVAQFFRALADNSIAFLLTVGNLVFVACLFCCQLLVNRVSPARHLTAGNGSPAWKLFLPVLITGAAALSFVWLLGYYSDRLTFTLAPVLLIATAVMMNREKITASLRYFYIFYLVLCFAYVFFLDAPHFSNDYFH
jgi:hypothetical protein